MDASTNTQLPMNINDSALDPAMASLPVASSAYTDMSLPVLMIEMSCILQQQQRKLAAWTAHGVASAEALQDNAMEGLLRRAELILATCNPIIPLQRATIIITRVALRKADFVTKLQYLTVTKGAPTHTEEAINQMVVYACEIVEIKRTLQQDEQLRNYHWANESYTQYHTLLFLLRFLCTNPTSDLADRAWEAVGIVFDVEEQRRKRQLTPSGSKWGAIEKLRDKAERIRRQAGEGGVMADVSETPRRTIAAGGMKDRVLQDLEFAAWNESVDGWDSFLNDLNSAEFGEAIL